MRHSPQPLTRDRVLHLIQRMKSSRVVVVGDIMLDRYLIGDTERLSPEAPVPVVTVRERHAALGGAANVAANVAAMGARCFLVGAVGDDGDGASIRQELAVARLEDRFVLTIAGRPTTSKTRIMARGQQIVRIDDEVDFLLEGPDLARLVAAVREALADADALLLEDYNKGALSPELILAAMETAKRRGIPTVVDPKYRQFFEYAGATVFKPNRREPWGLHLRRGGQGPAGRARADHPGAGGLHEHAHRVPRGLHPRPPHAPGQSGGVRLGGRRALGGLPAVQGMSPRGLKPAVSIAARLERVDWAEVAQALDERGWATTPPLLTAAECAELIRLYPDEHRFRSRVDMARFRFGEGEYKYFANPLPPVVLGLRRHAYPRLAPIATAWETTLGTDQRYPTDLDEFLTVCAKHGQTKPTPLLLRYEPGGYNCLHQDIYGDVAFPLQMTCLLSRPGQDFTGGEFLLVEQRPRAQSTGSVVPLERGQIVIFTTRHRPTRGTRGAYRVTLRHGVSRVTSGERYTLGVIFHDAK